MEISNKSIILSNSWSIQFMSYTIFLYMLTALACSPTESSAQNPTIEDYEVKLNRLSAYLHNDSLLSTAHPFLTKVYEDTIVSVVYKDSIFSEMRKEVVYEFIPTLVEALKIPNSYDYGFEKLKHVSVLKPDNDSFRIFTWTLKEAGGMHRHFGAIQLNNDELKLIPLFDMSDTFALPPTYELSNTNWYGCLYYNIHTVKAGKKNYYTLFGYDQNDVFSDKKVMEILHFSDGKAKFGAPVIEFASKTGRVKTLNRFFVEYQRGTSISLNYRKEMKMVVFDHTQPSSNKTHDLPFTYIPDGTYEGFVAEDGKWKWREKIFDFSINQNDNPPVPDPKFEKGGDRSKNPLTGE